MPIISVCITMSDGTAAVILKDSKGKNIPICAQAVGVADAYDALTTQRVYKAEYTPETAFSMILNGECGQFSQNCWSL